MFIVSIALLLVFIGGGLVFSFQNAETVSLHFLFWIFETPLGLIIIASFVFGLVLSLLSIVPTVLSRNYQLHKLKRLNENLQKRLDDSGILFESGGLGTEGEKYKNQ